VSGHDGKKEERERRRKEKEGKSLGKINIRGSQTLKYGDSA